MIPAPPVANPARVRWTGQVAVCLICGAQPLITGECPVHPPPPPRAPHQHLADCDLALPITMQPPAPACSCPPLDATTF